METGISDRCAAQARTTRMNKATGEAPDRTEAQSPQKRHISKQSTQRTNPSGTGVSATGRGPATCVSPLLRAGTRGVRSGLVKETELAESKPSRKLNDGFLCVATISLLHTVRRAGRVQEHLHCWETSLFDPASEFELNRRGLTQMNKKQKERHNESAL